MQAVILAAGEGIRLRGESIVPKCLLRVGKKTVLEHLLSQLPKEIREVIIVVGELKNQIKKHIGTNFNGRHIRYALQTEPLGTGHALSVCKDILDDKKFLVLMGDNLYLKRDMESCLRHDLCLLTQKIEAPERFGVVKVEDGNLEDVIESPKLSAGTLVNCGLYVLDKKIFNYLKPNHELEKETFEQLAKEKQIAAFKHNGFWKSMNTLKEVIELNEMFKKGNTPWIK